MQLFIGWYIYINNLVYVLRVAALIDPTYIHENGRPGEREKQHKTPANGTTATVGVPSSRCSMFNSEPRQLYKRQKRELSVESALKSERKNRSKQKCSFYREIPIGNFALRNPGLEDPHFVNLCNQKIRENLSLSHTMRFDAIVYCLEFKNTS